MKPIPGFSDYLASEDGRVYSKRRRGGRMLSQSTDKDGYKRVQVVRDDGRSIKTGVHRLVAMAYIPNPENKKEVNHKDNVRHHNWKSNLEWATRIENIDHATGQMRHIYGEKSIHAKLADKDIVRIRKLHKYGMRTLEELTDEYLVGKTTISRAISGKSWSHICSKSQANND